jgi:hypothetical protein
MRFNILNPACTGTHCSKMLHRGSGGISGCCSLTSRLSVADSLVLYPATLQAAGGIVVCPVNDTATVIPLVAPAQRHLIIANNWKAFRQVDIV